MTHWGRRARGGMRYRRFGNTDLTVSELGFGCARVGGVFQSASKADQVRLLRESFHAGITLYDTADMYAQGDSERLLGEAFSRDRDRVVIASKVGYRFANPGGIASHAKPVVRGLARRLGVRRDRLPRKIVSTVSEQDFSSAHITRSLEATLKRLRSDYVDVYQLHSPPTEVLQRGEFVMTLEELKRQGKVRCWGVACEHADDVLVCLRHPEIQSIQIHVSLLHRQALADAIPAAQRRGVGVIARQVLASGLLVDSLERARIDPRYDQILEFDRLAGERGQSLPEMALGFVLAQRGVSVALLGMHTPKHLEAALGYMAQLTV